MLFIHGCRYSTESDDKSSMSDMCIVTLDEIRLFYLLTLTVIDLSVQMFNCFRYFVLVDWTRGQR
jgi:hypothetical protein